MNRSPFFSLAFGLLSFSVFSQKIPHINSAEVIQEGKALYDSGKYEASALKLLTVPKRDTNYVYMLSELALTYNGDKKYDKAIDACNEALQQQSEFTAHMLSSRAVATDKKGNFDEAVRLFNEAIQKYPFDHTLVFNLGITYYNHKDYAKAEDCFFRVLSFNPYHAGSHFNLARLEMGRGRRTHAAFAMGAYLSINKNDNSRLVLLNKFLGNELTDEEGLIPASGTNACERLDQIIRSKIAMEEKFQSKIPVDAAVVKQFELIFNQLSLISPSADDRWVNYYLPLYKTLKEKEMVEIFIYHMATSANNENVQKWLKKNDKKLAPFYDAANAEFNKKRKVVTTPESFGYKEPVQAWYDRNNYLEALGTDAGNDKRQGIWYFFHNNFERSAEGKYDADGKRTGIWKFYSRNGTITSIENFDTGEVTVYNSEGGKKEHFFLKNDVIEGEVETYFPCGAVHERLNYKAGKREGKGTAFFTEGQKNEEYTYHDNRLDGEVVDYYANGFVEFRKKFSEGQATGKYQDFYPSGKAKSEGEFLKGEKQGPWKYYYSNGQLEKNGNFKTGVGVGEWTYYDHNGVITEKRTFDQSGNWTGDNVSYYKGKEYTISTYKNNILIKSVFLDKTGKQFAKFEGSNGTFAAKTFYAQGQMAGEGNYKKGKMNGPWVYYFPDGSKWKEYNYTDGVIQGDAAEYFINGAKKFVSHYKDGEYDGYFQEFYKNGQVKQEGWNQKGQRQQQWLTYYQDGAVESDYYYLNGQLVEQTFDYNEDGRIYLVTRYKDGLISDVEDYNSQGKKYNTIKTEGLKKIYETKYPSGKPRSKYEIQCGYYTGKYSFWFPNGNIFNSYDWSLGRRTGQYKYYTTDNTMEWGGPIDDGSEEGGWTAYNSVGKKESQGNFFNGERDSTWTYYYPSGKVSSTAYYRDGERDDASSYYSPDGTLILQKLFEAGQLVAFRTSVNGQLGEWQPAKREMSIIVNYPNGTKAYEEQFKNGVIEGSKKFYYNTGKIYSEYNFKEGNYEGSYVINYPTGKPMEKGNYIGDRLNGTRQYFNEDGSLLKSEQYAKGVREGSTIKYSKGTKTSEIVFWGGVPEK